MLRALHSAIAWSVFSGWLTEPAASLGNDAPSASTDARAAAARRLDVPGVGGGTWRWWCRGRKQTHLVGIGGAAALFRS